MLDKSKETMYYIKAVCGRHKIWSSIEVVITGTTGNRVYPKRVPRVQIPPAPPEQKHRKSKDFRCFSAFMAKLTGINVIYQAI